MSDMRFCDVIRAAMPGADDATCEHVFWGMTPYPVGRVTAQSLYRAASRLRRAGANNRRFCDWCHNLAQPGRWTCKSCDAALGRPASPQSPLLPDEAAVTTSISKSKGAI
jgi:hypothetical protein